MDGFTVCLRVSGHTTRCPNHFLNLTAKDNGCNPQQQEAAATAEKSNPDRRSARKKTPNTALCIATTTTTTTRDEARQDVQQSQVEKYRVQVRERERENIHTHTRKAKPTATANHQPCRTPKSSQRSRRISSSSWTNPKRSGSPAVTRDGWLLPLLVRPTRTVGSTCAACGCSCTR